MTGAAWHMPPGLPPPRSELRLSLGATLLIAGTLAVAAARWWPGAGTLASTYLLLLSGGLVAGLLAGLLGIGGALVTLPVLYVALPQLGVSAAQVPATAVSTALMAMLPTTVAAAWRQHRRATLHLATLRRLSLPMTAGAAFGALVAAAVNGPVLALLFAAQSSWYGARLLARPTCAAVAAEGDDRPGAIARASALPPWLAGPPIAAFCACVGMGGGSIVTPYLHRRGLDFRRAVATASALNLAIAGGGSAAMWLHAQSRGAAASVGCLPVAALILGGAAVLSVPAGVALAHRLPTPALRRGVGLVNLVAALTLIGQLALR